MHPTLGAPHTAGMLLHLCPPPSMWGELQRRRKQKARSLPTRSSLRHRSIGFQPVEPRPGLSVENFDCAHNTIANYSLPQILHSWKSFCANQINKITGSRGAVWHQESFDRIVRSPDHLARIQAYIRDNPYALAPDLHPDTRG